ncbi:MAG TPA: hypothetical protein VJB37_00025 [Patescibacteria group bacterium]|nr:hypothetical protein [Patescibacteria group bacterium]
MLGLIIVSLGTFLEEITDSIGKDRVNKHQQSPFTMAFLSLFWVTIFFSLISLFRRDAFVFQISSLPTFIPRAFLEIAQLYVSTLAIVRVERSTFSFIRTFTIPLLLLVDLILGYVIGPLAMAGMAVLLLALLLLLLNKGIKKTDIGLVIFSTLNAVITISLYKYDITHFNSVVAEQLIIYTLLLVSFSVLSLVKTKENPFKSLTKPICLIQSLAVGLGGVIISFGYGYGPASVITAAKRATAVFWSLLSGGWYFHEKKVLTRSLLAVLLLIGLSLLAIASLN